MEEVYKILIDLTKRIEDIEKSKEPQSIEISNLQDIPRLPDSINFRKPAWLPLAFAPLKPIKESLDEMNKTLREISRKLDR